MSINLFSLPPLPSPPLPSPPLNSPPLPSPQPPPRSSYRPHASSPTAAPSSTLETRSRPHPHSVTRPIRAKKEGNIPVVLSSLDPLPHKPMKARQALQTTDQHGQIHRQARPERHFKPQTSMPRTTDQKGLFLLTPHTGRSGAPMMPWPKVSFTDCRFWPYEKKTSHC